MSAMTHHPNLGAAVMYCLNDDDVRAIIESRTGAGRATKRGNDPRAGDVCPAVVVKVFEGGYANLQVLLDGNDTLWVTSRTEFDEKTHGRYSEVYDPNALATGPATGKGPWMPDARGHWSLA